MLLRVPLSFGMDELWATDGTAPGKRVTYLNTMAVRSCRRKAFPRQPRRLLGVATIPEHQIWYSDGTDEGTVSAWFYAQGSKVSSACVVGTEHSYRRCGSHLQNCTTSMHRQPLIPLCRCPSIERFKPVGFITAGDGVVFQRQPEHSVAKCWVLLR